MLTTPATFKFNYCRWTRTAWTSLIFGSIFTIVALCLPSAFLEAGSSAGSSSIFTILSIKTRMVHDKQLQGLRYVPLDSKVCLRNAMIPEVFTPWAVFFSMCRWACSRPVNFQGYNTSKWAVGFGSTRAQITIVSLFIGNSSMLYRWFLATNRVSGLHLFSFDKVRGGLYTVSVLNVEAEQTFCYYGPGAVYYYGSDSARCSTDTCYCSYCCLITACRMWHVHHASWHVIIDDNNSNSSKQQTAR